MIKVSNIHAEKLFFGHNASKPSRIGVRARVAGGLQPPDSGKAIIFRAKAKFFGQKPAAKNEKKIFFCIYQTKKGIHAV